MLTKDKKDCGVVWDFYNNDLTDLVFIIKEDF